MTGHPYQSPPVQQVIAPREPNMASLTQVMDQTPPSTRQHSPPIISDTFHSQICSDSSCTSTNRDIVPTNHWQPRLITACIACSSQVLCRDLVSVVHRASPAKDCQFSCIFLCHHLAPCPGLIGLKPARNQLHRPRLTNWVQSPSPQGQLNPNSTRNPILLGVLLRSLSLKSQPGR